MANCECIPGCPFFNGRMAHNVPAVVESMKKRYCLGSNATCARHVVFQALGRQHVPPDLIPNQIDVAKEIIAAGTAA